MSTFQILLIMTIYLLAATINAGAVYAYWCKEFPSHNLRRGHLSFSWAFSLFPILGWVITFFATDFYAAGWRRPWTTTFDGDSP